MRTRIYAGSALVLLVALVVAAVITTGPLSRGSGSSNEVARGADVSNDADMMNVGQISRPSGLGQLRVSAHSETVSKPYIGVVIGPLADGEVEVLKVLEDGPSDGVIEIGDVITAVNGETLDGAENLTDAIAETGTGETLTLTVTRDGSEMDVAVTVGEWTKKSFRKRSGFHRPGRGHGPVSSMQVAKADAEGNYHTHRTVFGSVTAYDETAGTFAVQPKDGSDTIEYSVNDDTRIYVGSVLVDDLSGVDTDEDVVVMDVDGVAKVVKQGDAGKAYGFGNRMGRIHMFGPHFGARNHRALLHPAHMSDVHKFMGIVDFDMRDRMRGLRFDMAPADISSFMRGIDDGALAAYAPDGFEERLERFLEDSGVGGRISIRLDGDGLNVTLQTEDGVMNFSIPYTALNDDDSS